MRLTIVIQRETNNLMNIGRRIYSFFSDSIKIRFGNQLDVFMFNQILNYRFEVLFFISGLHQGLMYGASVLFGFFELIVKFTQSQE